LPAAPRISLRAALILSPAEEAIARFAESARPGVWPHIPKAGLIRDIRNVVADPFVIKQEGMPLCGPAAILFELAARHPERYVAICQELYETGKFQARTKEIRPSTTLRNSAVAAGLTSADWMLMATLRDVENALFPVEAGSGEFVMGFHTPWEMKGWTSELLGFDDVEYTSTYFYGEFDAMREAERARNAGGVAFLMINGAMCGNDAPLVGYPDHWVSFLGGLKIDEGVWYKHDSGHIWFDCYSWGDTKHIDLGEGPFEDYMWGVVTGK
jgi:hypothetical protein